MEGPIIMITLCATVFGIVYLFFTTRHKERLSLIEKGADASLFNTGKNGKVNHISWAKFTLKIGMLFMGVAVGIVVAAILAQAGTMNAGAVYPAMIFFFGGLSLILFYIIDRKGNKIS